MSEKSTPDLIWRDEQGNPVTCVEKLKVLDASFADLKQEAQDVFEDGILIGVSPDQLKDRLIHILSRLENPYSS